MCWPHRVCTDRNCFKVYVFAHNDLFNITQNLQKRTNNNSNNYTQKKEHEVLVSIKAEIIDLET